MKGGPAPPLEGDLRVTKHLTSILFALCSLAGMMPTAQAGTNTWTPVGQAVLYGGTVHAVAVDPTTPTTLYAVSDFIVYKSTDSGAHWTAIEYVSTPLGLGSAIAIEPENDKKLFVATTREGGVFTSTDGGTTWTEVTAGGLPQVNGNPDSFTHVAVDPVTDGTAYVTSSVSGIYKTTDGGQSWAAMNTGLTALVGAGAGATMGNIAVDPTSPQTLYLAVSVTGAGTAKTADAGVYTSTDGGGSWTQTTLAARASDVEIDPTNHTRLIAATAAGLYLSTNSGSAWTVLTGTGAAASPSLVRIDPTNDNHLVVGTFMNSVYESTDGGATWDAKTTGSGTDVLDVAFDPTTPARVYAAINNFGLFKSTDGGATWAESDTGITNVEITHLAIGADGAVYVGSFESGLYRGDTQGSAWGQIDSGITPTPNIGGISVQSLAADPTTGGVAYVGTSAAIGVTTGGTTFTSQALGGGTGVEAIAIDPATPTTVYAGLQGAPGAVYKSTDSGTTWTAMSTGITGATITALAVGTMNDKIVLAGTAGGGVFLSEDGASTWTAADSGLPANADVTAVAIDPTSATTMYTAVYLSGIYKSTDGGATWIAINSGLFSQGVYESISIDATTPTIVYAMGTDPYLTTDGGMTWNTITDGLPSGTATTGSVSLAAAALDPKNPGNFYAMSSAGVLYAYTYAPPSSSGGPPGGSSGGGGYSSSGGGDLGIWGLALLAIGLFTRRRSKR